MLKVHGLCLLVLAICATFAVSFEREDVECPGCGVRSGTGGFTVVDANDNVLPGWCCGVVARFSPGVQVVDIPGLCVCDDDLNCVQKDANAGCSKILAVEFRLGSAFNVGSYSYLGGSVVVNGPQNPPGSFGIPAEVAMPGQPCDGGTRFVKVFDLYSDDAGTQFLCSIKFKLGCDLCSICDISD